MFLLVQIITNLLFPMKVVCGGDNEPSARLCQLRWTAIGTIGTSEGHGALVTLVT